MSCDAHARLRRSAAPNLLFTGVAVPMIAPETIASGEQNHAASFPGNLEVYSRLRAPSQQLAPPVSATSNKPPDSAGYDAGKKIKGKKRHTAVDTLGLLINFAIAPGDVQDRNMIALLLAIASKQFPSLQKAIADGGYQGKPTADDVKEQAGIPLEIIKRSDAAKGFYVLPKRWIVERTYGWLNRCRRLVKDYENLTRIHAAFIILAMIRLMLRRFVRNVGAT